MVRVLWEIVLALFGIQWMFPETVKEVLFSWSGSFVGKKRKQKLKNSFVCNLWSWAKVYIGEESSSLIGFLEWLAST